MCCMKILIYLWNFEKKIKNALLTKQNERQHAKKSLPL